MHTIKYICPMLGERVLITFSQQTHEKELIRLRKLKYKIIDSVQD